MTASTLSFSTAFETSARNSDAEPTVNVVKLI